jgi:hypothetical protein
MKIQEIDVNVAKAVLSGTTRFIYLDVLDEDARKFNAEEFVAALF